MTPPADDLDRIMEVMTAAFDSIYGEAWTRRQVEDALFVGNCSYAVIGTDGQTPEPGAPAAGFFLSRTGCDEEELLLLAVNPDCRRRGLGRILLSRFAEEARARGARRLLLEMRKGNPADSLYRSFGFEAIGRRPNYYRTRTGECIDAITFALVVN